jgi:hypothetical protein
MAGKGDTYRPVNRKIYNENYDHIFRKTTFLVTDANLDNVLKILKRRYNYSVTNYDDNDMHFIIGIKRPDDTLVSGWGTETNINSARKALIVSCQNAVNELGIKDETI